MRLKSLGEVLISIAVIVLVIYPLLVAFVLDLLILGLLIKSSERGFRDHPLLTFLLWQMLFDRHVCCSGPSRFDTGFLWWHYMMLAIFSPALTVAAYYLSVHLNIPFVGYTLVSISLGALCLLLIGFFLYSTGNAIEAGFDHLTLPEFPDLGLNAAFSRSFRSDRDCYRSRLDDEQQPGLVSRKAFLFCNS